MQGLGWALLGADLGFFTRGSPGSAQALGKPRPAGSTATLSRCLGFVIQQSTSGLSSSDCHQRMAAGGWRGGPRHMGLLPLLSQGRGSQRGQQAVNE